MSWLKPEVKIVGGKLSPEEIRVKMSGFSNSLSEIIVNSKKEEPGTDLPNVDLPNVEIPEPANVITEAITASPTSKENGTELQTKELSERQFVFKFLSEVQELLNKGKELETSVEDRDAQAKLSDFESENKNILKDDAEKIEASLKAFVEAEVTSDKESATFLKESLQSFEQFLSKFATIIETQKNDSRSLDANLLSKINSKKIEISELVKKMGGQINFERIKNHIRDAERIAAMTRNIAKENRILPSTAQMINTSCVNVVSKDLKGATIILESNSPTRIADILVHIFTI